MGISGHYREVMMMCREDSVLGKGMDEEPHFWILLGPLAIPKKFANNLREKLEDSVSLTRPSGATCNVRLTLIGDALFLKDGWKEFVDAHSLEEDDLLIFKYNGSSRFDVSVFDRQSLCEKEVSCFVKKCEHADVASRSRTKRHTPREYSSRNVSEAPPTKKPNLAATPTSEDTSKSSSHDEYEPPAKKKTLAPTSTSTDTNESSSHNECEPPTKKKTMLASTSTSRTRSARANAKLRS
ncbi:putative serpin-ZX-like [Capsicum annuum]|nr:putative serpin-ZX-like [Capsicum annuum]